MNYPYPQNWLETQTTCVPPGFQLFLLDNVEMLEWLLAATGAHEQLAEMRKVTEDLYAHLADADDVYGVLRDVRNILGAVPIHAPFNDIPARPDIDACLRWLGARLDELLTSDIEP